MIIPRGNFSCMLAVNYGENNFVDSVVQAVKSWNKIFHGGKIIDFTVSSGITKCWAKSPYSYLSNASIRKMIVKCSFLHSTFQFL